MSDERANLVDVAAAAVVSEVNEGQSTDGPAVNVATESRVILDSAKGSEGSAKDMTPPSNQGSADKSNSHPNGDRSTSEEHVATPFYYLNPAEIFEIAFNGLPTLKKKFESTWVSTGIVFVNPNPNEKTKLYEINRHSGSGFLLPLRFVQCQC